MDPPDLERVLRAALVKHSRVPGVEYRADTKLDGGSGLDSFALLSALLDVEDQLGLSVPPERLAGVRELTFAQLAALLLEARPAVKAGENAGERRP